VEAESQRVGEIRELESRTAHRKAMGAQRLTCVGAHVCGQVVAAAELLLALAALEGPVARVESLVAREHI